MDGLGTMQDSRMPEAYTQSQAMSGSWEKGKA